MFFRSLEAPPLFEEYFGSTLEMRWQRQFFSFSPCRCSLIRRGRGTSHFPQGLGGDIRGLFGVIFLKRGTGLVRPKGSGTKSTHQKHEGGKLGEIFSERGVMFSRNVKVRRYCQAMTLLAVQTGRVKEFFPPLINTL